MSTHEAHEKSFCTVFACMDGRCQHIAREYCLETLGMPYPDTVTIAGCDGVLIRDHVELARAKRMAEISVLKHGSSTALVIGHGDCAGNPVDDETHHTDVQASAEKIAGWGMFDEVVGLFIPLPAGEVVEVCRLDVSQRQNVNA